VALYGLTSWTEVSGIFVTVNRYFHCFDDFGLNDEHFVCTLDLTGFC